MGQFKVTGLPVPGWSVAIGRPVDAVRRGIDLVGRARLRVPRQPQDATRVLKQDGRPTHGFGGEINTKLRCADVGQCAAGWGEVAGCGDAHRTAPVRWHQEHETAPGIGEGRVTTRGADHGAGDALLARAAHRAADGSAVGQIDGPDTSARVRIGAAGCARALAARRDRAIDPQDAAHRQAH